MKVKVSLVSLMVLVSSAVSGLRDRKALCIDHCQNADYSGRRARWNIEACNKSCNIPLLDFEAGANAELICQLDSDRTGSVLQLGTGKFIIEIRSQSSDWIHEAVVSTTGNTQRYIQNSNPSPGRYQWRFMQTIDNGTHIGISRPEITDWVTVREPGVKPPKVLDVWLNCLSLHGGVYRPPGVMIATIGFRPAKDSSCRYKFICSEEWGSYYQTAWIYLDEQAYSKPGEMTVNFGNLTFGSNFTVSVQPMAKGAEGDKTFFTFSTPSHRQIKSESYDYVRNLKGNTVTALTYHKEENIYDVNVSWQRPYAMPHTYTVKLTSYDADTKEILKGVHTVCGISTGTIFRDVKIPQQRFNVSITTQPAFWFEHKSFKTSKLFTIPYGTVHPSGTGTIVITAVLTWMSLVVATGICA